MRLDYSQVCRVFSWLMTDVKSLAYCRFSIPRHVLLNCIKYQAEGATTIKPVCSISPYLLLSLSQGSCIEFLLWLFLVVSYEVEVENEKNSFHHKLLLVMVFISARKHKLEQKLVSERRQLPWQTWPCPAWEDCESVAELWHSKALEWSIFKELFYGSLKDKTAGWNAGDWDLACEASERGFETPSKTSRATYVLFQYKNLCFLFF